MLIKITGDYSHWSDLITPLAVKDGGPVLSIVFAAARNNKTVDIDLSMNQFEHALEDAAKEHRPFVDLTPKGVAEIKAKYTPS